MYEHNALGFWSGLALCLTMVRSSRARCPATALVDTQVNILASMKVVLWLPNIELKPPLHMYIYMCATYS